MTLQVKPEIKAWMNEQLLDIQKLMPIVSKLSDLQCRDILSRYGSTIEPNFITWIAAGLTYARTPQGKFACEENLRVELEEDHQGMLHDFVVQAKAVPSTHHFADVQSEVREVRRSMSSGYNQIPVLAYLESTSTIFMPVLEKIGRKLKVKDFTYTEKHGMADIAHADQFLWALGYEHPQLTREMYSAVFKRPIENTKSLLTKIFTP